MSGMQQLCKKVAKRFSLGSLNESHLFEGGAVNDCYLIETSEGEFVVKVLGNEVDEDKREQLALERRVLERLEQSSFPYSVPTPLTTESGEMLVEVDGEYLTVAPKLAGEHPDHVDDELLYAIGRAIGQYHNAVDDMDSQGKYTFEHLDGFRSDLQEHRTEASERYTEFIDSFLDIVSQLEEYGIKEKYEALDDTIFPVHGDFTADNILLKSTEINAILDFDNIRFAPPITDLSWTAMAHCYDNTDFSESRLDTLLDGYRSIRSLSEEEEALIKPSVLLDNIAVFLFFYDSDEEKTQDYFEMFKEKSASLARELDL